MSKRKNNNQEGYGNNRNNLKKLLPKEREEFEYKKRDLFTGIYSKRFYEVKIRCQG